MSAPQTEPAGNGSTPKKTVAILGASGDRRKFGNKAVRAFTAAGWQVFPINPNEATVEGLTAYPSVDQAPTGKLDVVSLYVPPQVGVKLLPALAARQPGELWVNPGAGSPELVTTANGLGLTVRSLCSILALGLSPGDFPDR